MAYTLVDQQVDGLSDGASTHPVLRVTILSVSDRMYNDTRHTPGIGRHLHYR